MHIHTLHPTPQPPDLITFPSSVILVALGHGYIVLDNLAAYSYLLLNSDLTILPLSVILVVLGTGYIVLDNLAAYDYLLLYSDFTTLPSPVILVILGNGYLVLDNLAAYTTSFSTPPSRPSSFRYLGRTRQRLHRHGHPRSTHDNLLRQHDFS